MLDFDIAVKRYIGAKITHIAMESDQYNTYLSIFFEDGRKIRIFDSASYCCEYRYMATDDFLGELVGETIIKIELKDGPEEDNEDAGEYKEIQFLEITTSGGFATLKNYNVHNGYYGGFDVCLVDITDEPKFKTEPTF